MARRLVAILAADMVGYSAAMSADEAGTLAALQAHRKDIFEPQIALHSGRIFKLMGDGTLVEFPSVVDAVACALSIQKALLQSDGPIRLRIGINVGDVILEGDDIYGEGVNVAARLEKLAEPGGICISSIVRESLGNRVEADFADAGSHKVKGIPQPVRVWRWPAPESPRPAEPPLALPAKPSIAVLPFTNLSGAPEEDYFADGITEEIITTLSKVSKLFIIARNSTLVYKGRAVDIRQVGREQGVQFVLEGSVRGRDGKVRVTAQLIEAETGRHLWAQRYDRVSGDILALQDDVAKEIVSALQVELTEGEQARLAAQGTQNAEAWQLTFQGRDLVHAHHKDSVHKGRSLLERAIGLDETYALAWGALAEAHWKDARHEGWSASPERSLELALEASDRALALDPENAGFLAMRSIIITTVRKFDEALTLAETALRTAHSEANAIALAALTLSACGKPEAAIQQTRLAMRYCPRYPPWYLVSLAYCYWMLEREEETIAACHAAIAADPDVDLPYVVLAMVHAEAGDESETRQAVESVLRVDPNFSVRTYLRGLPYRDPKLQERRRAALEKAGLPD